MKKQYSFVDRAIELGNAFGMSALTKHGLIEDRADILSICAERLDAVEAKEDFIGARVKYCEKYGITERNFNNQFREAFVEGFSLAMTA